MHYVNNKECKYCRFLKKQKETKLQVQLKLAHLCVFVFVFEGFTSWNIFKYSTACFFLI